MRKQVFHKAILCRDSRERFAITVCLFLLVSFLAGAAFAQVPGPGDMITSRTEGAFRLGGNDLTAFSNTVSIGLLPVYGPMLLPDGSVTAPAATAAAFSGEQVIFQYTLGNSGNDEDSFDLFAAVLSPSDFIPVNIEIYLDQDGDGLIDPGEETIVQAGPLSPGESVHLVASAWLPSGLSGAQRAHLDIRARSVSDTSAVDAGNVVRIEARNEASISLVTEADRPEVMPGETFYYTLDYVNTGEREAEDIIITDFIDYSGMSGGTEYLPGSAVSSLPGMIEYFDIELFEWVEVAPPAERVKGVRLHLETLIAGAGGYLSFALRVDDDHESGPLYNTASCLFTGVDAQPYSLNSNEHQVMVGQISALDIGPAGDPSAPEGSAADRVVISLAGSDSTIIFWHEIFNGGNYMDTVEIVLADSAMVHPDWTMEFIDGSGYPLSSTSQYTAAAGVIPQNGSVVAGLRISSTAERLRAFEGRELDLTVEARSLVDDGSRNTVHDILVKADIPLLSVKQSVRETSVMTGDIASYIVTVENLTEETTVDSIILVERVSPGLGYVGGSEKPRINGNILRWELGRLEPGEKKEVVFRAAVKAGQEKGHLTSSAWVYGISVLGERTADGPAIASVRIIDGLFSRKGIVFGSVFVDKDGDGMREKGEKGIKGVSVYLENGTYAITDSSGAYTLPGTYEGTHVVRADPKTFPDSLEAGASAHFGLRVEGEYLIDLPPSGNRRVDFPLRARVAAAAGSAPSGYSENKDSTGAMIAREESGPETPEEGLSGQSGAYGNNTSKARSGGSATGDSDPAGRATGGRDKSITNRADGYEAITIPSAYFSAASAILEEIPIREVASLGLWMMEHPGWRIMITGHTDSIPISTIDYPSNFELSLGRARSVFQLLRMNGIPEEKMDYSGVGDRYPIASNSTAEGRALNRRVNIKVIPPDSYSEGDPGLPAIFAMPDTTEKRYSLADDAGICSKIVSPDEGHIFTARDKIDVEVVTPLSAGVELYVNNIPVGREKLGQKRIDTGNNTLGVIFYDVKIAVGRNDILVVCRNRGERSVCVRYVYLAGNPAGIVAEREKISIPADGNSTPEIIFLVNDESGLPVRDGIFVTLDGPGHLIGKLDINPHQPGVQLATEGGKVAFTLPGSRDPLRTKIDVVLDRLSASCGVTYESPMRDWFLFGFGEGEIGYSSLSGAAPVYRTDEKFHDGLFAEGKLSLYGQGEIATGHLMTLAVDTRPIREDILLGRIEPEKQYPLYGDASELKFNSASRSGTYLRVDNRRYNVMFGDFKTELGGLEFTRYNRTFNGVRGEANFTRGGIATFITRTDQVTWQEEINADGTSGFYFLSHFPLTEHSEEIRIEVRDRYRPENIIRVDDKKFGRDYDINYMDGSILFKEPVAARDRDLNPVTIVVSYECRDSKSINFIYGIRPTFEITDSLSAGATVIIEEEGTGNSSITGIDLSGYLYRGVSIETEYTRSDKFLLGKGEAFRVRFAGSSKSPLKWSAYYRDVDANFYNPGFTGGKTELGSRKTGIDLSWMINSRYSVAAKAFDHYFRERGEEKRYLDLCGRYRSGWLTSKAGFGAASYDDNDGSRRSAALLIAAAGFDKGRSKGELQVDQIIGGEEVEEYPNRIQADLSYELWKNIDGTLKHEYRTGRRTGTRHLTQLGLESRINEDLSLYSRYRMEGAMSGERGQSVIGLKNRFRLSDALTSTVTVEKLATVSGAANDDYTAFSTGWLYTPAGELYKLKGDYEIRIEPERVKHLVGLAGIKRLGRRWSGIFKGDLWYSNEEIEFDRVKGSSTLGSSFRPVDGGPLTIFSLARTRYEKNSPAHPGTVDKDLTIMTEANYLLGPKWEAEGKIAGRWVRNCFKSYTASSASFLWQASVLRTFEYGWDLGISARIVHQRETSTVRYGGGLEVGKVVAENVWVGCGYDFGGHSDSDASINDFEKNGFHVGMKMKFNEKILDYFYAGKE
ncbi:MAG: OmpA family protein [Candidatus Krumholzibacteriota bacterium]|nr:OmpA family protein [Candidatus Krumholzibacteriota bacterium]